MPKYMHDIISGVITAEFRKRAFAREMISVAAVSDGAICTAPSAGTRRTEQS